jgi:hypothetical protein
MQAVRVRCQVYRTCPWQSTAVAIGNEGVQPYQSLPAGADPIVVGVVVRQISGRPLEDCEMSSSPKSADESDSQESNTQSHKDLRSPIAPPNPK